MNRIFSQHGTLLFLFTAAWLLSACSLAPVKEDLPGYAVNPESITHWQITGKIAYRSPEKNSSGRLLWKQAGDQFNIGLSNPLGQGVVKISGTPQDALVEIAGQDDYYTSEPEHTLREQIGADIPLDALIYWVLGVPVPHQISLYQRDTAGRNISIEQAGWNLEYSKYQLVNGFWLPGKISIRKQDKMLLLVINHWVVPLTPPL